MPAAWPHVNWADSPPAQNLPWLPVTLSQLQGQSPSCSHRGHPDLCSAGLCNLTWSHPPPPWTSFHCWITPCPLCLQAFAHAVPSASDTFPSPPLPLLPSSSFLLSSRSPPPWVGLVPASFHYGLPTVMVARQPPAGLGALEGEGWACLTRRLAHRRCSVGVCGRGQGYWQRGVAEGR